MQLMKSKRANDLPTRPSHSAHALSRRARLPVVDREEALAGAIALDDPLEYIADELAGIARVSSRGGHAERKRRA